MMKQILKTIWNIFKRLCWLFVSMMVLAVYASRTNYRDEWALTATGGNPMPHETTWILIATIVTGVFLDGFWLKGWKKYVFITLMVLFYILMLVFIVTTITSKP